MSRLDDELRWALRRREPSQDFAERVLARIALQDAAPKPARGSWWRALLPAAFFECGGGTAWAMVGALACLLAVTVGVHRYRVNERTRAEGEVAKAQVMLALQIASAKLNFAQRKVLSRQDERNPRRSTDVTWTAKPVDKGDSMSMKLPFLTLVILICAAISAAAQNPKIQIENLDRLFSEASETVDVTVDGTLLQVAARFLNANKPDEAKVRELLAQLKGVYVKSFEFDRDGAYSTADVDAIRSQLSGPGWSNIATVRSRRSGNNVDVHMMLDGGLISGVAVLVVDPGG
jgi:hypothetical protein